MRPLLAITKAIIPLFSVVFFAKSTLQATEPTVAGSSISIVGFKLSPFQADWSITVKNISDKPIRVLQSLELAVRELDGTVDDSFARKDVDIHPVIIVDRSEDAHTGAIGGGIMLPAIEIAPGEVKSIRLYGRATILTNAVKYKKVELGLLLGYQPLVETNIQSVSGIWTQLH